MGHKKQMALLREIRAKLDQLEQSNVHAVQVAANRESRNMEAEEQSRYFQDEAARLSRDLKAARDANEQLRIEIAAVRKQVNAMALDRTRIVICPKCGGKTEEENEDA